jgi:hypothetical protein
MAKFIECLPSKHEALSSNSILPKKKKKPKQDNNDNKTQTSQAWWYIPVISVTWETEVRRITV